MPLPRAGVLGGCQGRWALGALGMVDPFPAGPECLFCVLLVLEPVGVFLLEATWWQGPDGGFVEAGAYLVGGGGELVTDFVDPVLELGDQVRGFVAVVGHEAWRISQRASTCSSSRWLVQAARRSSSAASRGRCGAYRSRSSAARWAAWAGSEVGTVAAEGLDPWWRASSRFSATRWAMLLSRPRVIATYAAAAVVCSPSSRCPVWVVSPWAPWTVVA